MLLVYGLTKAPSYGWSSPTTIAFLAGSLILFIIFVVNEMRVKHPLIPMNIFKIKNVAGANIIQICLAASLFSTFFFCTLFFQEILGYSPVKTGLAFLAVPVAITLTASTGPKIIKRFGFKWPLMLAPILTAGGLFWLGNAPINSNYFTNLMPALLIMGIGLGFTFISVLVAATSGVAGHLSGLASGLINTSQQVGGSLGLAILTGIVTSITASDLAKYGRPTPLDVAKASLHADHVGFFIASGFSLFASVLAVVIIRQINNKNTKDNQAIIAV